MPALSPARPDNALAGFHPAVAAWFRAAFPAPTPAQAAAWPAIRRGEHVLVAAPTGSGKTLTAFLAAIDDLVREGVAHAGALPDATRVLYISPLKALSNDIHINLDAPLEGIRAELEKLALPQVAVRTAVRTGDTPQTERTLLRKLPPHVLVTTPESLYVLLGSASGRAMLAGVHSVIIDEIHAIAGSKRGAHLSLSLERLEALCQRPLQRIGLSATQKPIGDVARFLLDVRDETLHELAAARGADAVDARADAREANPHATGPRHGVPGTGDANAIAPAPAKPSANDTDASIGCTIVDVGHARQRDLGLELPPVPLEAVMSNDGWGLIYDRLAQLVESHRTTLVFVNTRRLAERAARHLSERLGKDAVAAHHGSLSRELRLDAEQRLKRGALKVLVATASLELGIDIGDVDLVCQLGSPRSINAFLQRAGRAGHAVGGVSKARLFPTTRDELVECAALLDCVRRGELDTLVMPPAPLDALAQQIVAEVASREWSEDALFALVRRAWPYRALSRATFDDVLRMLAEGYSHRLGVRGAYIHRDQVHGLLRGRRGAALTALTSGGTIPDTADYKVVLEPQSVVVGSVNEDFAVESLAGDVFQLGNASYRILRIERDRLRVEDARGAMPNIPFWIGEAPGRSDELSFGVSRLREELSALLEPSSSVPPGSTEQPLVSSSSLRQQDKRETCKTPEGRPRSGERSESSSVSAFKASESLDPGFRRGDDDFSGLPQAEGSKALAWLREELGLDIAAATQLVDYLARAKAALGVLPTQQRIVFERFFDESGGTQLVIHTPYGSRLNRAWGLALRKRFCRQFNFELQAAATEDAIVLSLSTSHSFPLIEVAKYLHSASAEHVLTQALLDAPLFPTRWRWNAVTALALPRFQGGRKVPPQLQRMKSEDLLATVFPDQVACLENIVGERQIPDHPLVAQTLHDCLREAMDTDGLLRLLHGLESGDIAVVARDLTAPSPLAAEVLGAAPYAFLDDAPLEERRTQAVQSRRWSDPQSTDDLGRLDVEAIDAVRQEAWPQVRSADEMHEALAQLGFVAHAEATANAGWPARLQALAKDARATRLKSDKSFGRLDVWTSAELLPTLRAVHPEATLHPAIDAPRTAVQPADADDALRELLRGRLGGLGPVGVASLAASLAVEPTRVEQVLLALQTQGYVMQGRFSPDATDTEWCERHLLARIHRYTLGRLRREIEPVSRRDFMRFLFDWQHVAPRTRLRGPDALASVLVQLEGYETAAGAWETDLLPARVADYAPSWLDELCRAGRIGWHRLRQSNGGGHGAVRATPIVLLPRRDLPTWSAAAARASDGEPALSSRAQAVADALREHGALFFDELLAETRLLRTELEDALGELVAAGWISADSFAGLRALLLPAAKRDAPRHRKLRRHLLGGIEDAGRWSLRRVPATSGDTLDDDAVEHIARGLLRRYGVVFWQLLEREAPWLPSWRELLRVYRRLEARGEIRGGRFVEGLVGEQFALPDAIAPLRAIRQRPHESEHVLIGGCDPLNLAGSVLPGDKLPALPGTRVLYEDGIPVAARVAGKFQFLAEADEATRQDWRQALQHPERVRQSTPVATASKPVIPAQAGI